MKELLERLAPYFGEKADSMEQIAKDAFKKACYKLCVNENIEDRKSFEIEDDYYLMTSRFEEYFYANGDFNTERTEDMDDFLTKENKWSKDELDGFAYIYAKSLHTTYCEYCPCGEEDEDDDDFELRGKEYAFQEAYAKGLTLGAPIHELIGDRLLNFCGDLDIREYTKEDFDERVEDLCDFYLYNKS